MIWNCRINLSPLGPVMNPSPCSVPSSSTMLLVKLEYVAATINFITEKCYLSKFETSRLAYLHCIAKLLPMHILPPLPNAQNQRSLLSIPFHCFEFELFSSQRSGCHPSGSGNASGFRWRFQAYALTRICSGMSMYFPSLLLLRGGVIRGWPPGTAGCRRKVSITMAWSSGSSSTSFADGISSLIRLVIGGHERCRSSSLSWFCILRFWESSQ